MAFTLLEQAHQESVFGGSAANHRAIDDEQAIGIAVLYQVSGKVRSLHEPERIYVAFPLCTVPFYHLSLSCHRFNSPGSGKGDPQLPLLINVGSA